MALLDLKTNLKSLKYGSDTPGGGNSGQPYQQVDINTADSGFNRFRMTKFDDGLVRGGVVGAANASIVDTFRIGKFLKDFPKGPLFIVKQVGLQLSNPQLETKKLKTDNPTTGGGLLRNVGNFALNTANKIVNAVGPTRIYNLGINTLAQVPVNAFGQHFNRHGLLPVQDDQTKYLAVAQNNNSEKNNRLTGLRNRFGLGTDYDLYKGNIKLRRGEQRTLSIIAATFEGGIPFANSVYNDIQNSRIADYIGGPSSVYGIGRTLIPRTPERTNDKLKIDDAKNRNYNALHIPEAKISSSFDFGISLITTSNLTDSSFDLIKDTNLNINSSLLEYNAITTYSSSLSLAGTNQKNSYISASRNIRNFVQASLRSGSTFGKENFNDGFSLYSNPENDPNTLNDTTPELYKLKFKPVSPAVSASADLGLSNLKNSQGSTDIFGIDIPTDINAIDKSLDQNVINYSNPLIKKYSELRNVITSTNNAYKDLNTKTVGVDRQQADIVLKNKKGIEITNELKNKFVRTNDIYPFEDAMALKFVPLDPFTGQPLDLTLNFLGYLNEFTENYNSNWGDVKYTGRSEKFYIFNEFTREVNVGFNIPCFHPDELEAKHCQLSALASTLAGKYNDNGLLGGIITRLKLGKYVNDQPGIIKNLTFSPIQDSSWDLDAKLAFYIKVNFGFTVIHNFLPQYYRCGFIFKEPDPVPQTKPPREEPPIPETTPTTSSLVPEPIPQAFKDNTNFIFSGRAGEFQGQRGKTPPLTEKDIRPFTQAQDDARRNFLNKASRN
jgi:hypothetical protein